MRVKTRITEHERYRRTAGLSASVMGRALGLADHSYVSHIECGTMEASPAYRAKAARLLQASESELFDTDGFAR